MARTSRVVRCRTHTSSLASRFLPLQSCAAWSLQRWENSSRQQVNDICAFVAPMCCVDAAARERVRELVGRDQSLKVRCEMVSDGLRARDTQRADMVRCVRHVLPSGA